MPIQLAMVEAELARAGKPADSPFVLTLRNGQKRCARVEVVTNNRLAPGEPVRQLRFACDCLCAGISGAPVARRQSKRCRQVCPTPGVTGQPLTIPSAGGLGTISFR